MAASSNPKSILKKTPYPATAPSRADRDRETALYHANLIQQRKDTELEILLSMEKLIDYPLSKPPNDASNPSPSDANDFKNLLGPFQPSDYDDLILERNINEHCGYTLCPNERLKEGGTGKYRIIGMNGKAKDFRVVDKSELEKWCSDACAKRALYVRVQLSERPAWERGAVGYGTKIDLLDEPKLEDGVAERFEKMDLSDHGQRSVEQAAADLAFERGDKGSAAKGGLVSVTIKEKDVLSSADPLSMESGELTGKLDSLHLSLEGYTTNFGRSGKEEEGAGDDMDWKL